MKEKIKNLWKDEEWLTYLILVFGVITIFLTWWSYNLNNKIDELSHYISSKNTTIVQYGAKYTLMNVLNPLIKGGILTNSKPESEPKLAYQIYLQLIEEEFASDESYWKEINSIKTIQDFLDKVNQVKITRITDKIDTNINEISMLLKIDNSLFVIIVLIQMINVLVAYRLGVLTRSRNTEGQK